MKSIFGNLEALTSQLNVNLCSIPYALSFLHGLLNCVMLHIGSLKSVLEFFGMHEQILVIMILGGMSTLPFSFQKVGALELSHPF
jgi:hypothetical protein